MAVNVPIVNLTSINGQVSSAVTSINDNFTNLKNGLLKAVSTDAQAPNQMLADLDLNGHKILNVAAPTNLTDVMRLQDATNPVPVLSTNGVPSASFGKDGNFALDGGNAVLYGPKANGVWPAGISLIVDAAVNKFVFATKAAAIASTGLASQQVVQINATTWVYSSAVPSHPGAFQNTSSGRWYVYGETLISEKEIADPEIFNGNRANATSAAFALNIPLVISGASGIATLNIDPVASALANTDAARMTVLTNAHVWRSKCICSNGAEVVINTTSLGKIAVTGQISVGSFSSAGEPTPAVFKMLPPYIMRLENTGGTPIVYGTKYAGIVRASLASAGAGYTPLNGSFVVPAVGGGVTGCTATAWVNGTGGIASVTMLTRGTGATGPCTFDFSSGGGSGAVANGAANLSIVPVTIKININDNLVSGVTPTFPPIYIGMPIGLINATGTAPTPNDAGACTGGGIVTAFNSGAQTITYEICQTQTTALISPTVVTATILTSSCAFIPQNWYACRGGFSGSQSGIEGFLNASMGGSLILDNFHLCWEDGEGQDVKGAQVGIGCGLALGRVLVRNYSVIGNFPNATVRMNSGVSYLSRGLWFGGVQGADVLKFSTGGQHQVVSGAIGSCNGGSGINIAQGVYVEAASLSFGACNAAISNNGGELNVQLCLVSNCLTGINTLKGRTVGATSNVINRCNTSSDVSLGGTQIGANTHTNQIATSGLESVFPINSEFRGGSKYIASVNAIISRRYWDDTHFDMFGSGSPETVVTAPVGCRFLRSDGGANTTTYVKESGAAATGWIGK